MSGPELTIIVQDEQGRVAVDSFLSVVRSTLGALRAIDMDVSASDQPSLKWRIARVSYGSPLELTVAAERKEPDQAQMPEIIDPFFQEIKEVDRERAGPVRLSRRALGAMRALGKAITTNGFSRVEFRDAGGRAVIPSAQFGKRAAVAIRTKPQYYMVETELTGRLGQIIVHGRKSEFCIYDPLTDEPICCHFDRADAEKIGALLTHRLRVFGRARYKHDDVLVSIEVHSYEPIDEGAIPRLEDLHRLDIDITKGRSSEDFIRGLRDDE